MSVVVVSWFLTLMAVFGLTYAHDVRDESRLVEHEVERHQLRAWAWSGVEMARAVLDDTRGGVDATRMISRIDASFVMPLACGEGFFSVGAAVAVGDGEIWRPGITDEAGRLPIALVDSTALNLLPGMSRNGVEIIMEAKRTTGQAVFPPFDLLPGLDAASRRSAERYLSRYGVEVNINSAPLEVLVALGLPEAAARKLFEWRCGPDKVVATVDDRPFTSLASNNRGVAACRLNLEEAAMLAFLQDTGRLVVDSRFFSLHARGWGADCHGVCEVAVILEKTGPGEAAVVEWTENWLN